MLKACSKLCDSDPYNRCQDLADFTPSCMVSQIRFKDYPTLENTISNLSYLSSIYCPASHISLSRMESIYISMLYSSDSFVGLVVRMSDC